MIVLIIAFYLILGAGYLLLCRLWCKWLWARLDEWEKNKGSGGWSPGGAPAYKGPPMPPVKPPKPEKPQFIASWDPYTVPYYDDGQVHMRQTGFECSWCKAFYPLPTDECPNCHAKMRNAGVWE